MRLLLKLMPRITRAASYTELPGSCGSSDRTDSSSERTSSTRTRFVSNRTRIASTWTGCEDSTSSLGNPPNPLATSLSEDEVRMVLNKTKVGGDDPGDADIVKDFQDN